jgi:hypothetical protein
MSQDYTDEDSNSHFNELLPYFLDKRYIKINNKPLFLVYRPDKIPNPKAYFNDWRKLALDNGLSDGLYICAVKNGFVELDDVNILELGYDAIVDFQPDRRDFPIASTKSQIIVDMARKLLPNAIYQALKTNVSAVNKVDYAALVDLMLNKQWPSSYRKFPCVFPSWDNTARRKTPTVIQNMDGATYERWLNYAIDSVKPYPSSEQFVFINACSQASAVGR